ncbi:hypothetical protein A3F66_02410 [candidate division TM6 bacterium RIFCSPHIGHO2_12_FULL_32_22]|nr:MAG: hypothetical protein A3F66_02410 [candidate division TM6 bacterium RIFCSPHIGHO2_12_FULL_32_22]
MNRKFLALILLFYSLDGSVGCMSRDYYCPGGCKCKDDYHYVECSCPCVNILSDRGRCRRCDHYGDPNRGVINAMNLLPFTYE